jgi:hypothetical protein
MIRIGHGDRYRLSITQSAQAPKTLKKAIGPMLSR